MRGRKGTGQIKGSPGGLGLSKPSTNAQGVQGRPSKRSIISNPPRQPSQLGKSTWLTKRRGRVSVKGGPH